MRSTFLKHTIQSFAFIVGLFVLLFLTSRIVAPKNNSATNGIHDPAANGILGETENTIDVLVLGDSESYCSIIPLQIWEAHGITSYVCGTSGQKLCYSEEFLHKAFEKQNPKIVILETNAIFRSMSPSDGLVQKADRLLPIFRYHNRWKSLKSFDFSFAVNYTHVEDNKGYWYSSVSEKASSKNYMKPSDKSAPIPTQNEEYVKKIRDFCNENGAELILVSTPSTKNWNYKRHNSIQALADELELSYIDMNVLQEEIPIDWNTDTRDKGDHMNYYGAAKVTEYLGTYLSETGLFPDHRNDNRFQSWDIALEAFKQTVNEPKAS